MARIYNFKDHAVIAELAKKKGISYKTFVIEKLKFGKSLETIINDAKCEKLRKASANTVMIRGFALAFVGIYSLNLYNEGYLYARGEESPFKKYPSGSHFKDKIIISRRTEEKRNY